MRNRVRLAAASIAALVTLGGGLVAVTSPAHSQDVTLMSPYRFYAGVGAGVVHHTGYMPNTCFNSEMWVPGVKLFGGVKINDWLLFEAAYHYLGTSTFFESAGVRARETAHSLSGSLIYYSPALSRWLINTPVPIHILVRGGLAYKNIHQTSAVQTNSEGIFSFVVGAGLEFELTRRMFARVEYEFISTAIGGPSQRVPSLKGLFDLNIGGTRRVVNLMNTPITASLGWRF